MAKTSTILQVFVGSPSDVTEERRILEEVVNEINLAWGNTNNVRLELIKWETHTRPDFGEDAQDVINRQIGDEYDIFIGIMWGRFGSPTNRSDSGTEEEFDRAYTRLKESPEKIKIMFYFKDAGIPPSKMDPNQLSKVQAFKTKIASEYGALYHQFETAEEFRTKSSIHLSTLVQDWLKTGVSSQTSLARTSVSTASIKPLDKSPDPLANLMALTDDDFDEGVIELSELANDAMEAVTAIVKKMTDATNELGLKFKQRTDEINLLATDGITPDIRASKRIANNTANDLEVYVRRLSVEIPEFHKEHSLAMDTFEKIAMISNTDLKEDPDDIKAALLQIQEYRNGVSTSSVELSEFQQSIADMPRMTTAFNRARRRAIAILEDLLVQLRTASNQIQDVEILLVRMSE